jgi:hypothetical protein
MRFKTFILFSIALLLFSSCAKKLIAPIALPEKTLAIEEIDFEYFHGKARLSFKDEKREREVKANIRIRKDSVIWMNFTVIGLQGGRVLINKDSITILSNVNNEYYVYTYPDLSKRFNFQINYHVVQAAILGNLIMPSIEKKNLVTEGNFDLLNKTQGPVSIKNFINNTTKKLEKVEMMESSSGNSIKINYGNFQAVHNKSFAFNNVINIVYKTLSTVSNNTISLEYNSAEVGDKELRFPFKIPKRFDRR